MDRKIYNLGIKEVYISYEDMHLLSKQGIITQLSISKDVANDISEGRIFAESLGGLKGIKIADKFWKSVGLIIFLYSIYLSFTSNWWLFFPGFIILGFIFKSNKSGNADNILDLAKSDKVFYDSISQYLVYEANGELPNQYFL